MNLSTQNQITPEVIVNWFSEILRTDVNRVDDAFIFSLSKFEVDDITIRHDELKIIIDSKELKQITGETILYDNNAFEILVREETRSFGPSRFRDDKFILEDTDNKISYEISPPSNEYLIFILHQFSQIAPLRVFLRPMFNSSTRIKRLFADLGENISIFDIIKIFFFRYSTLKILTRKQSSLIELNKLSNAFVFHLAFNLDITIVQQIFIRDLIRHSNISRIRRISIDELDPPRRLYNSDLVYHYQMAVSTDSPYLEYLSYYHIMENYFESVFNDELVEQIKNKLTSPEFSYKRKKDINGLVKFISKSLQYRNENMIFSEIEALRLTLARFVNLTELRRLLTEYDSDIIEYYKSNEVSFSKGDAIDFNNSDENLLFKLLSSRIYKTRNSLVHSKENEKSKYTPFKDDRELINELPLMRFISEGIILFNSITIE